MNQWWKEDRGSEYIRIWTDKVTPKPQVNEIGEEITKGKVTGRYYRVINGSKDHKKLKKALKLKPQEEFKEKRTRKKGGE